MYFCLYRVDNNAFENTKMSYQTKSFNELERFISNVNSSVNRVLILISREKRLLRWLLKIQNSKKSRKTSHRIGTAK